MEGKIVCITGASSGIGANICIALANDGATVIGLARRVENVNELNGRINEQSTGRIIGIKCNIEEQNEIFEAFAFIRKEYTRLDVFINNAGILMTNCIIEDQPENLKKIFDVNVIASCICLKEAINLMKETAGKGQIIIMNSVLGHRIPDIPPNMKPLFGLYPASKHALVALAQSLRQEVSYLKLPIKITSISPGMVETGLLGGFNQELLAVLPKLKVEDVTEAVKYVLNTPDRVRVDDILINPMM